MADDYDNAQVQTVNGIDRNRGASQNRGNSHAGFGLRDSDKSADAPGSAIGVARTGSSGPASPDKEVRDRCSPPGVKDRCSPSGVKDSVSLSRETGGPEVACGGRSEQDRTRPGKPHPTDGAPGGRTDSLEAFHNAWNEAGNGAGKETKVADGENDLKKISKRLEGQKAYQKKIEGLKPGEREAADRSGLDAYHEAIAKGESEEKALKKADDAAGKKVSAIKRDNGNIRDVNRRLDGSSDFRNRTRDIDDSSKSSIYKAAEDAYRKAKNEGAEDWKAMRAATDAGNDRSKEVKIDSDRAKEIEALDPALRERVQGAMQQASQGAALSGADGTGQQRAAGKAGDSELKDIKNEQIVEKYKGKMGKEDRDAVDKAQQEAYDKAISEGRSPSDARREGTKAAMDKVEPSKTLPPLDVPRGYSEKAKTFGEPGSNQVTRKMAAGKNGEMIDVTCHAKLADRMETMFQELKDKGMSHLLKQDFGGCSYYRDSAGGGSLSNHSWGIAFDVNAGYPGNGFNSSYPTADQDKLAEFFGKYGFQQLKNDRMHFEYCH